ncbi:MAG: nucleotidyltransferase domain-containing protein [Burkholderiales bacterium]
MRLADDERQAIGNIIRAADADARIYLYGSRTDDAAKGGDIDVLVLSKKIDLMDKLEILAQLHSKLGERKIDIAVYPDTARPFSKMIMRTGLPL